MFLLDIDSESKVDSKKYKFLKCKTFTYLLIIWQTRPLNFMCSNTVVPPPPAPTEMIDW